MAKGRVPAQNLKRDPLMEQYVNTSSWVRERRNPIVKWLTIAAVALALAIIVWLMLSRRQSAAADSLAEAYRFQQAIVANPIPPNTTGYAFTTEDEKHRRSFEAFEKAAKDYPSINGEIGRYYAATHQIFFEPEKAEATLKDLSSKDSEVGAQARMALAQRYEATGKYDEAVGEFQKLKAKPFNIPVANIDYCIARTYEAQGKNKEAAEIYFTIASDKDIRSGPLGNLSVSRLTILAPEKIEKLPAAEPSNPLAGLSGGFPMR
ncbi:MAG: hypothetical protein IPG76_15705 [Acidobacteria bacterium]|nr:hypothetical protein [Acidobacteriota bacterium]